MIVGGFDWNRAGLFRDGVLGAGSCYSKELGGILHSDLASGVTPATSWLPMSSDWQQPKPVDARSRRRRIPRSFRELTPSNHFNPRTFFREMVWKALMTPQGGSVKVPRFPHLQEGQLALTWIGHASFLLQFSDLNLIIDPNFANWLFLLKRLKRPGLRAQIGRAHV